MHGESRNHEIDSAESRQSAINTTIADLAANGGVVFDSELEVEKPSVLFASFAEFDSEQGFVQSSLSSVKNEVDYPPDNVFLASLSKIAVVDEYIERFPGSLNSPLQISTSSIESLVAEIDAIESLGTLVDERTREIVLILKEVLKSEPPHGETISAQELIHLSLVPSSNQANALLSRRVVESIGNEDEYLEYMREKYGYDPTIGLSDLRFLFDDSPNVGDLATIAQAFNRVLASNEDFKESMSMSSQVDSGYNFAASVFAQELVEKGYKVYEKFGDFPYVFYVRSLAKKYPPFMTFLSLVSIEDPSGHMRTFVAYNMIQTPIPNEMVTVNAGGYDVSVPDEEAEPYATFIGELAREQKKEFRRFLESGVKDSIGVEES